MEARIDTHPSPESLKAFGLGRMDDASAQALFVHLEHCPTCRRRAEEASDDDFLDRLQQARASNSTPAPAGQLPPLPGVPKPAGPGGTLPPDPARSLAASLFRDPSPADAPDGRPVGADLPPELVANQQYEVIRELGRGGMGVVYLARNRQMDRLEVLKVVNRALLERPGTADRFLREIRSAAALEHKNVVRAYACLQVGKLLALVMEYVEGEDLARLVERRGPLSVSSACASVIQAARGLQEAHDKGMVHRDIKPQNLLLSRRLREVMILDFGLAKVASEKRDEQGLTAAGKMLGTPAYVAPEQALDAATADIRADIYSLGCTLYYLLTGHAPFDAPSLYALLFAHQNTDARPLNEERPEVPPALAAVVARMMAKDPAKRYQKPADVAAALAPFVKGVRPTAPAPAPPKPTKQERKASISVPPPLPAHVQVELVPATAVERAPFDLGDVPAPAVSRKRKKGRGKLVAVALALLVPLAVGVAMAVLRLETPNGTLIVEMNDPDVEARIKGGKLILTGPDGKTSYILTAADRNSKRKAGEYKIRVDGADGLALDTPEFTLKQGGVVKIRVTMEPKPAPSGQSDLPKTVTVDVGAGVKMEFVLIPAGKFKMGSHKEEEGRNPFDKNFDSEMRHEVDITTSFYLAKYPVTQSQYTAIMGKNPSAFSATGVRKGEVAGLNTSQFPVEAVTWAESKACCIELTTNSKQAHLFRLPTEAEWEYACRAGTQTTYFFGDDPKLLGEYGWYRGNANGRPHPVGEKKPNAWGLYDMHGNLWQWCEDYYGPYDSLPSKNPLRQNKHYPEGFRVQRGGPFCDVPGNCRAACRLGRANPTDHCGFRMALDSSGRMGSGTVIEPKAALDPDRKAAQYVLSIGGVIRINDAVDDIKIMDNLPTEAFRLTHVDLAHNQKLRNADLTVFDGCKNLTYLDLKRTQAYAEGLAHFKECTTLKHLDLEGTGVEAKGLAVFKACKGLKFVNLAYLRIGNAPLSVFENCQDIEVLFLCGTQINDDGLRWFKNCRKLIQLDVGDTKVRGRGLANFSGFDRLSNIGIGDTSIGDEGLSHLRGCKNLEAIHAHHSGVTDAGLAYLKDSSKLTFLKLAKTPVSDAGLAHLSGCKNLTQLFLENTKVGDEGMRSLKGCVNLSKLGLFGTKVGDAGLTHLEANKNLTFLGVRETKVTTAGIKKFKEALPSCAID